LNIFVINLSGDVERRQFQKDQLSELGLEYKILNAVSIDDISNETYTKHYYDWQRPLRNTEVACYFSHRSAWQKIINNNMPALILEDDALLSKCVPELLNSFTNKKNVDFISLEVAGRKKFISKIGENIVCNSKLYRLYQDRNGAAGYILWPSGAKKLLQYELENGIALADAQIASCNTLLSYQIEPAAILQLCQCNNYDIPNIFTNTIQASTVSHPNNPKVHVIFWIKRIVAQIKLGMHIGILILFKKANRRHIKLNKESFYNK
jgi:glycosyl transferase family 25